MHNQFKTQKFKHLMLAMGPRDLHFAPYSRVHCSSHSMASFQSSELTELPLSENSQLFAQRAHSARYAPKHNQAGHRKLAAIISPLFCLYKQLRALHEIHRRQLISQSCAAVPSTTATNSHSIAFFGVVVRFQSLPSSEPIFQPKDTKKTLNLKIK